MRAKDIMVTDVPVISIKTTIGEAVRILKKNYGDESFINAAPGLIVLNERGGLAGILTPLSVITAIIEGKDATGRVAMIGDSALEERCASLKDHPIAEIMERQAISVTEDALLADVADLFVKHRFQRVPVVKGNRVVGIIYRSKLLFAIADTMLH